MWIARLVLLLYLSAEMIDEHETLTMDLTSNLISLQEVKQTDMVCYFSALGFEPCKIRHDDYWYLSPLRNERTASFKINRRLNRWYDHGIGQGGNIIDFGILFFNCTMGEFLKNHMGAVSLNAPVPTHVQQPLERESKIVILKEQPLESRALLRYLKERKIPISIAREFCAEVHYSINDNSYYGIGFKNDLGGFEIRNPYFKASSSPKSITSYQNNSSEVYVFEGFFDFMSFKALQGSADEKQDFIILNSLSFFEKSREVMEKHQLIHLFLDRDQPGEKATEKALGWSPKYTDQSQLYKDYKDYNQWILKGGKLKATPAVPRLKK